MTTRNYSIKGCSFSREIHSGSFVQPCTKHQQIVSLCYPQYRHKLSPTIEKTLHAKMSPQSLLQGSHQGMISRNVYPKLYAPSRKSMLIDASISIEISAHKVGCKRRLQTGPFQSPGFVFHNSLTHKVTNHPLRTKGNPHDVLGENVDWLFSFKTSAQSDQMCPILLSNSKIQGI